MKLFVAGATGVLGRRAVRDLVAAGHDVTGIARSEEKGALLRSLGATPARVDLFDADALRAAVAGHDGVLNLATHIPPVTEAARRSAWAENERIRSEGARNLVDAAIAAGASLYVQEALAFAYEDSGDRWIDETTPLLDGVTAVALRAAEGEAARFPGRAVVLRFGQFYAPEATHTVAMVGAARRGLSMNVGGHDGYAPSISADDAARAVVAAIDAPAGTYNVVDDVPLTRRELDAALADAVGGRRLLRAPTAAVKAAGEDAKIFFGSNRVSNASFKEATGWAPRFPSAREGYAAIVPSMPGERTSLLQTVALAILGISGLGLGLYATFWPRAFYDDFPSGRGWVAADGPFNEHLVRDFGGLNLGLGFVALLAAIVGGRWLVIAAAGSSLLFGVPHLAYHLRNLDRYDGFDVAANVVSLSGSVVLGALVLMLALARRAPRPRRGRSTT